MRIASAEVVVTCPDRNFVTLVLTTDDGLVGLGDATVNGRELAAASYLQDHVAPMLLGRDAHRIEDTWQLLYRSAYWRRGPITMAAIAAVDMALWDLKGKAAGMPVYQLLGGASRDRLLAYGHASGTSIEQVIGSVSRQLELGYRAVRIQSAVPGLDRVYGVAAEAAPDPAGAGAERLPVGEVWDSESYLRHIPGVFEAVRHEFGAELPLLHDAHHRLMPMQAAQLGRSLEPYRLLWLEDCTPAENPEVLRLVRQHTTTPLAIGETFNSVWDFQLLIREQLIDYVRGSVTHTAGISHLKKTLEFAAQYQIKSGMHCPPDISPVGLSATLHLGLALHNFGIQEYLAHGAVTLEVFRTSFSWNEGYLHPGDEPGLGVELDRGAAARHPYRRDYLPYARLRDGTMHDW